MFQSTNYPDAYEQARKDADTYQRPMGIEKATAYGKVVYRVKMLPKLPKDRYGWETRCEVVDPGMPRCS